MITIEDVNRLLVRHDGDHSLLYPSIKDRVGSYSCEELPFPGEFLFFEDKYLRIFKHILDNSIGFEQIVDIGCQYGFQSEWIKGVSYVGIDSHQYRFFNEDREDVSYKVGIFPDVDIDLMGAVVISCMSLGYFNNIIGDDTRVVHKRIVDKLSSCKHLYISTTTELRNELAKVFPVSELVYDYGKEFSLFYFGQG